MEVKILLTVAVFVCIAGLAFIAFSVKKLNGIKSAVDRLIDFRHQVNGARRRVTSIQRVATAQGSSTNTGGVFALYDLHKAIEFADQVISTAENLIEARTSASLQACCELFECPEQEATTSISAESKYSWSQGFSATSWKSEVDRLLERAESSILGEIESNEDQQLAA